jgi:ribosomal protein S18 acetylase RimI-like enzyme
MARTESKTRKISIRKAVADDVCHFPRLVEIADPNLVRMLFGKRFAEVLHGMFGCPGNLFSRENVVFAVRGGDRAGMCLAYDGRTKRTQFLRTVAWMLRCMRFDFIRQFPAFLQAHSLGGWVDRKEYYISSLAVYPHYRGEGVGTALLRHVEEVAIGQGCTRISLEAAWKNTGAIRLYRRCGFEIRQETSATIRGVVFRCFRMTKDLRSSPQG